MQWTHVADQALNWEVINQSSQLFAYNIGAEVTPYIFMVDTEDPRILSSLSSSIVNISPTEQNKVASETSTLGSSARKPPHLSRRC